MIPYFDPDKIGLIIFLFWCLLWGLLTSIISIIKKIKGGVKTELDSITWITGNDGAQVAVRNMPVDKMQRICEIIGDEEVCCTLLKLEEVNDDAVTSKQRWISVSERYPNPEDEYKWFLVTDEVGVVNVQEFLLSLDEEHKPYFGGMRNVVAWMPLPKPYKESEDEK